MINLSEIPFTDIRKDGKLLQLLTQKVNDLNPAKFHDQLLESRVRLLMQLLRETLTGRYHDLSLLAFSHIVIALDYFIRIDDDMPDTLTGGYEDDLEVVQKVHQDFKDEIEDFKKWQSRQPKTF